MPARRAVVAACSACIFAETASDFARSRARQSATFGFAASRVRASQSRAPLCGPQSPCIRRSGSTQAINSSLEHPKYSVAARTVIKSGSAMVEVHSRIERRERWQGGLTGAATSVPPAADGRRWFLRNSERSGGRARAACVQRPLAKKTQARCVNRTAGSCAGMERISGGLNIRAPGQPLATTDRAHGRKGDSAVSRPDALRLNGANRH